MKDVPGHIRSAIIVVVSLIVPFPISALTLELPPGAIESGTDRREVEQVLLPVGPRDGTGGDAMVAEGQVVRRAWSFPNLEATPFQILQPVQDQLNGLGFQRRFECRDRDCGGFDFRLALDLLPAPAMHVDLGDFRYLVASRDGSSGAEVVSLVVSRSQSGGHLHVTFVTPPNATGQLQSTSGAVPVQEPSRPQTGSFGSFLDAGGRAVLPDLEFRPGSSELGEGPFGSVEELANWLEVNPNASVILVGHSDNIGGLEDNIRLSERRAAAVARALIDTYGVSSGRIASRGVGFLSPIASNATAEGRLRNRRVEAVVASR